MKALQHISIALTVCCAATGCEQGNIYEPLDFSVRLSSENTYVAGEPVVFDFKGNADYITMWSGDTGHEYKYRDRSEVAMEDILSCTLKLSVAQAYGEADVDNRYCDILATDKFPGLSGTDAQADRILVNGIGPDHADWEELQYENQNNRKSIASVPKVEYTYDITKYAGNFSFLLHFHHEATQRMRTFAFSNIKVAVQFKGYNPVEYGYSDLGFVPFSTTEEHADDPYIHNAGGNGIVKFQGQTGSNSAGQIVIQGFNVGAQKPIDQWVVMNPITLNSISPDTCINIKGVSDDISSYAYVYDKPGTYTATFIAGTGNYRGESGPKLHEVTFTIVENL